MGVKLDRSVADPGSTPGVSISGTEATMSELNWHARQQFLETAKKLAKNLPALERFEFLETTEHLTHNVHERLDELRGQLSESESERKSLASEVVSLEKDVSNLEEKVSLLEVEIAKLKGGKVDYDA